MGPAWRSPRRLLNFRPAEVKTFPTMSARPLAPIFLRGLGLVALWTLVGLAFASQIYLQSNLLGHSIGWGEAIRDSLEEWYVYGALSVPVVWLARRLPLEAGWRWRTAAIHLGAALVFSIACVLVGALVGMIDSRITGE